jgi:hypothetical protein
MSHHTTEQVQAAFNIAPSILTKLTEAGIEHPNFRLFNDASGELNLGEEGKVTSEQYELAVNLVHSARMKPCYKCLLERSKDKHLHPIVIQFCCGLVVAAGEHKD